jgi:hypothetical protein
MRDDRSNVWSFGQRGRQSHIRNGVIPRIGIEELFDCKKNYGQNPCECDVFPLNGEIEIITSLKDHESLSTVSRMDTKVDFFREIRENFGKYEGNFWCEI